MNVVRIGKQVFTGPSGWDQITPRQYRQFLNWQVRLEGDPAGRYALLHRWYGIRSAAVGLLDDEQRTDLLALLDFLEQRPERWLLPRLRVKGHPAGGHPTGGRVYIGPGDGLDYLTFGEFMYAQAARDRFVGERSRLHLAELAASLYRSRAFVWQASDEAGRNRFDARTHTRQATRMEQLPETVLQGILLNYEGCLDRFPAQFPHLFSSSSGAASPGTWLDVGLSLARQTGALGTFADIEGTNLFLVLTMLDAIMKENAEIKANYEQYR